jgi:tRNA A-37 threonylcarbamoyl transferase component Bud32
MTPEGQSGAAIRPFGRGSSLEERARTRRRTGLVAVVALALLAGVAFWTYDAVRESLDDLLGGQLQAILDANANALALWATAEKQNVQEWAATPDVRRHVQTAVDAARGGGDARAALLELAESKKLERLLEKATTTGDVRGFVVVDASGLVLVAGAEELVGARFAPPLMAVLAPALTGATVLARPYDGLAVLPDTPLPRPLMFAVAPVRDAMDRVMAVLVFRIDPVEDFSRVLSAGRPGRTGHTYAFDDRGVMLSTTRFEDELRTIGLLPEGTEQSAVLRVAIRDPGGDLRSGYQTERTVAERPLTRMAAAAVTGQSGVDLEGYRDFRGATVIGAWRWLPEMRMGLATEMELAEAYRLLRPLGLAFAGLMALLLAATAAIVVYVYVVRRLQRRAAKAEQLGQYTVLERIGEGGMAVVYLARHAMLRRPTAVKVLKPSVANEETLARFEREVQLTSQLTHPNTVEIYDFGRTADGRFYYAMEYLQGISLADLIDSHGATDPARAIHILRQICGSLHEAHELGLIHRDIKPPNIMLCARGGRGDVVKVLDFGLVKEIETGAAVDLTAANVIAGTPQYIAPERIQAPERVDARADLYSVGALAFNLLTGDDVFPGRTSMEICHHVLHSQPRPPSAVAGAAVPPELDRVVLDCLAKDPQHRPASAAALMEGLGAIDGCGQWSEADARHWWETHQAGSSLRITHHR